MARPILRSTGLPPASGSSSTPPPSLDAYSAGACQAISPSRGLRRRWQDRYRGLPAFHPPVGHPQLCLLPYTPTALGRARDIPVLGTTMAMARPISRSTGLPPASGSSSTLPPSLHAYSSGARWRISPSLVTTMAMARPISRSTGLPPACGSSSTPPPPLDANSNGVRWRISRCRGLRWRWETDIAVYRPSTGVWFIFNSASSTGREQQWGALEDIPVPGDYDGDGKTDIAVYRPSTGVWFIFNSASSTGREQQWGALEDQPLPGQF